MSKKLVRTLSQLPMLLDMPAAAAKHSCLISMSIEFAYQLLLTVPTSGVLAVVERLTPLLHRDLLAVRSTAT
jgi:hypothetical protein